ncbi:zinc ribbon domain-containing protein [Candidatus Bathyarchaeota archaeon]|nr:zinc ribbon domain-containing protein [Candidatus Bathyarchaeota archaeon]
MVYCTKCGTENEEDAEVCKNCGASLSQPIYRRRRRDWDYDEDECFGGRSRTTWPLLIGAFLILLGLSSLLKDVFWWATWDKLWPLFIIAIGVVIVNNAFRKR